MDDRRYIYNAEEELIEERILIIRDSGESRRQNGCVLVLSVNRAHSTSRSNYSIARYTSTYTVYGTQPACILVGLRTIDR